MAHGNVTIPIPGELRAVDVNGRVVSADGVYDYNQSKSQETINSEVQEAIGTGGSVDTKIANAIDALDSSKSQSAGADGLALNIVEENGKITSISGSIASGTYDAAGSASAAQSAAISAAATDATTKVNAAKAEIKGNATSACDTLGEAEALISAETSRAQAAESALQNNIQALTQSDIVVVADHTSVSSPDPLTIYREQGTNTYSDWMYQNGSWKKMAEYDNAIDDEPTADSDNLVTSGGVVRYASDLDKDVIGIRKQSYTTLTTQLLTVIPLKVEIGQTISARITNNTSTDITAYLYLEYNDGTYNRPSVAVNAGETKMITYSNQTKPITVVRLDSNPIYGINWYVEVSPLMRGMNAEIFKLERSVSGINGKISIIGDSISSYKGFVTEGYQSYYPLADVQSNYDMWWNGLLLNRDNSMEVNASYSGSGASKINNLPSFYERVSILGNPDVIFVGLGTNDDFNSVPLGNYDYTSSIASLSETEFIPAYIKGVRALLNTYHTAKIFLLIFNMRVSSSYADAIKNIGEHYGLDVIDLRNIYDTTGDQWGLHPTNNGMAQIQNNINNFINQQSIRKTIETIQEDIYGYESKNLDIVPNSRLFYTGLKLYNSQSVKATVYNNSESTATFYIGIFNPNDTENPIARVGESVDPGQSYTYNTLYVNNGNTIRLDCNDGIYGVWNLELGKKNPVSINPNIKEPILEVSDKDYILQIKEIANEQYVHLVKSNNLNVQRYKAIDLPPLAITPPMGWSTWDGYSTGINENNIKQLADYMVSSGLRDAGYIYLMIDEGWEYLASSPDGFTVQQDGSITRNADGVVCRTAEGTIVPDATKFPNGLPSVIDYIHSKGLKVGLYSSPSMVTCINGCGCKGVEEHMANQFAAWGVDALKYDWCNSDFSDNEIYSKWYTMSYYLKNSGRDILFYLCAQGRYNVWEWGGEIAHYWRMCHDTVGEFDTHNFSSIYTNVIDAYNKGLQYLTFSQRNGWNDFDALNLFFYKEYNNQLVKNKTERITQMCIWCMLNFTMFLGGNVTDAKGEGTWSSTIDHQAVLDVAKNKYLIDINKDTTHKAFKVYSSNSVDVLLKELKNGIAIMVFNKGASTYSYSGTLIEYVYQFLHSSYKVYDAINNKELVGALGESITFTLDSHETKVFLIE